MFTEITADNFDRVWEELFVGAREDELFNWKDLATKYFHQGGFMYPLQAIVAGCLSKLGYSTVSPQKELRFTFNKNGLQIKENFTYTNLPNIDESLTLNAKEGSYLLRGELSHSLFVDINDKNANFQHIIAEVKLDYKKPKLKTHLDERSVIKKIKDLFKEFFKDLIPSLNNYAFFKPSTYKGNFCLSEFKEIEGTEYTRITK
ncbi:MAG: hypothetical protein RLY40_927 [Pseudomonadota bacterium]|jgi:hypothetical protein